MVIGRYPLDLDVSEKYGDGSSLPRVLTHGFCNGTLFGYRWVWKTRISWRAVCFYEHMAMKSRDSIGSFACWLSINRKWIVTSHFSFIVFGGSTTSQFAVNSSPKGTPVFSRIVWIFDDFRKPKIVLSFLPAGKRSQTWHQVRLCPRWKGRNGLVVVSGRNDEWYLRRTYSTAGGWIHQWRNS